MRSMIFFSIIIPTYNRADKLRRCLESLLKQEINNFEVIVVDDGSTDHTMQMIEAYSDHVRYLSFSENQGPNIRKNQGALEAHGEWLIFMDSDDQFTEVALEHLESCARSSEASLIMSSSRDFSGK